MAKKNNTASSLESLMAEFDAEKLSVPTTSETTITLKASALQEIIAKATASAVAAALGQVAPAAPVPTAPKGRKPPAPKPALVAAPAAKPEITEDAALLAKAKEDACWRAGRAACKAAGVGSDKDKATGKWIDRPNGGRFSDAYRMVFWAAFNSEAKRLGVPTPTK